MGLSGTGSSGVVVKDVFVSGEFVTSASALLAGETQAASATAPLYRTTADPLLTISQLFPALGAAQTAVDIFLDRLPGRMICGLNEKRIETAVTHLRIGEVAAKIDAAEVLVQRAAEALDRNAESMGGHMPTLDRARIRRDIAFAVRLIMEAVDTLASELDEKFVALWTHWRREREIKSAVAALAKYDERTLRDLGIHGRADIERMVRCCRDC
jgi:3-hydroxy-9,10-secoandrosta-1,3,5(10)-triene-9,17-dione monooxygenase